jgi:hypothetical protein
MAIFEATGSRLWGQALTEGWVLLHHIQAAGSAEVIKTLPGRFPTSFAFYLGQFQFDHFVLEVPMNLEFDVRLRIGRIDRATQGPRAPLSRGEVLLGLEGEATLSRLFGPRLGHLQLEFIRGERAVKLLPIAADALGVRHAPPETALEVTPLRGHFDFSRTAIGAPGLMMFGGIVGYLWLPPGEN